MKKLLCIVLAFSIFYVGCAGREGNPVPAYKPGDERRDCASLQTEVAQLDTQIATLIPKADKGAWNTLMFVTGIFVIVPLFFIDFKNGEKVELQACRERRNALELMAAQKGCVLSGGNSSQTINTEQNVERKNTNPPAITKLTEPAPAATSTATAPSVNRDAIKNLYAKAQKNSDPNNN